MKIVGLTGGIGSGKTTVANMFAAYGVPIYNSDIEAKNLTASSVKIREQLTALLGKEIYRENILDRALMANLIFNDSELLQKTNAIIHPEVRAHFQNWANQQKAPYVIKEAAILYESGAYKFCDATIMVTAPEETRIERVIQRDSVSRDQVMARIRNQWSEERKLLLADFVILNQELTDTKKQVEIIHFSLI